MSQASVSWALLRGGLRLNANKERSTRNPIRAASIPDQLIVGLDQHAGDAAIALVQPGDQVRLGQPLARPASQISAWVHSPVSGRILRIETRPDTKSDTSLQYFIIENDHRDDQYAENVPCAYESLPPVALCEYIARGGIVGLGGATFPTAPKLLQANASQRPELILNGAECEPWISCDDMLMRERAADVVFGAKVLRHALNADRCVIAIEDDVPQARAALESAVAGTDIQVTVVPSIYPAGGERQLIKTLTGREVPAGGLPQDIGIVCQNVGTAAAVARWIRDAQPLISRIVTVTGSCVREPANLEARIGTSIASLISDCGGYASDPAQLIMGGSMMGIALASDADPVVKGTNCVIAAAQSDLHPRGAEMPCIRCGNCSVVCPAYLLPQQLHWHALAADVAALEQLGLMDCIECGCCDYVCPSQIPLVERFREAKPAVVSRIVARHDATMSRERFESRQHRLMRLEQEQRARLEEKRRQLTGRKS
ncbi:MAG: electron transport complex subunit RsxC [Povalibacter sp.]